MPDLVAFDLETTGLSPRTDRIIEIGAVRFRADGTVVDRFEQLADPGMPVPLSIQRLTGITDADLEGAPSPIEVAAILADFVEGADLVAHGAAFDLGHCAALIPDAFMRRQVIDTLDLARILMPTALSHSLPLLSRELGIAHDRPHRALSDAEATGELLIRLLERAASLPAPVLATLRALVASAPPALRPLRQVLLDLVGGDGLTVVAGAVPSPRIGPGRAGAAPEAPRLPEQGRPRQTRIDLAALPLDVAAAAALGPDGPLADGPGYELRSPQIEMAGAVAQTLDRSGRLMVEAGTGTGKSLAYLVPLALWSARTGKRAVVATHTIALQEQLGERDLPRLTAELGLPLRTAILKGRGQHVSLRRAERFLASVRDQPAVDPERLRFALRLVVWLDETRTGDRSELRLGGDDDRFWREIESTSADCLGAACANWRDARCHMVAARRAAAEADIVVTNQALLLADAERQGQVLAAYSALVVDEAQHLVETATRTLGVRMRAHDVLEVLDRVPAAAGPLDLALEAAREGAQRLFGEIKGHIATVLGQDHPGNATLGLTEEVREHAGFVPILRAGQHAVREWTDCIAALTGDRAGRLLQTSLLPQPDRAEDEAGLAADTLRDAIEAVSRVLLAPRPGEVAWLELRAEQAELRCAPVSVDDVLQEHVFDRVEACVLTSATLSVAGSFEYLAARTGLGQSAETLMVTSPFDFLRQALTVVPTDVPPYDDAAYDPVLADLVADCARRLGGRTLVLFTGYAALRSACSHLRPRLEGDRIAVVGQGIDGTRRQVLQSFLQSPRTVLCGTTSFWEGIDIPGDALRCVVIAKLPFPVPTDPLVQARGALLEDPFAELALPEAVLRLKQGFGRLIRTAGDRGAVILADARILRRDYGATFLRALPEAAVARVPRREVGGIVENFVRSGELPAQARRAVAELEGSADPEPWPEDGPQPDPPWWGEG